MGRPVILFDDDGDDVTFYSNYTSFDTFCDMMFDEWDSYIIKN
jgi:hypothetical protein